MLLRSDKRARRAAAFVLFPQANKAKYGVDYGKKPEFRFFARYVEEARMAYNGICSEACKGEDEQCFGSAPDVAYCGDGQASAPVAPLACCAPRRSPLLPLLSSAPRAHGSAGEVPEPS